SFEKSSGAALLSWDGAGFYVRALASDLFWLPVALLLAFLLVRTWRRSELAARRFWAIACLGVIVVLTFVPHRQSRFAAALVPLILLALAELAPALARSPARLALVGLAGLCGVALSLPSAATWKGPELWSPGRGIPQLFLGPPRGQEWPHDALLAAAVAAVRSSQAGAGLASGETPGAVRIHLQVERGHPYLNRWTFQSHAWQAGVRIVANPANAHLMLSIARGSGPAPRAALASFLTPDGFRCSLLLPSTAAPGSQADPGIPARP
ncbi:MAG: hypothetical protein ABIV06_04705, partial [Thermoanaerobaculia bacterium]